MEKFAPFFVCQHESITLTFEARWRKLKLNTKKDDGITIFLNDSSPLGQMMNFFFRFGTFEGLIQLLCIADDCAEEN